MERSLNLLPVNKKDVKMQCPCENCIVRVLCRRKKFDSFRFCKEISIYLGFEGRENQDLPANIKIHIKNYPKFYKCLKPINWKYKKWPLGHERRRKDYQIIKRVGQ